MDRYEIGDYGNGMVPYDGGDWVNADEADKEIESLKVENNNLLVMVSNQQKEIESLRQQNKSLLDYIEIQDLKNAQNVVDDRDEWKRRALDAAEEAAYLVDHYRNGIKYDEDRNVYICIWTQKQIDDAGKEAAEICKKLKWFKEG